LVGCYDIVSIVYSMEARSHFALQDNEKPVVLIVDDQPRNLQLLGNALFRNGYDVAMAGSGSEALEIIDDSPPDLVLLDVMMPGMDGLEVCRRIKAREKLKDLAVIFVTAKTQKEDLLEGFEVGAVDYITKPIQIAEVLARVHSQISLKIARDELRKSNQHLSQVIGNQQKFLSLLSHDVRAPLYGVVHLMEDCLEDSESSTKEDLLEMVELSRNSARQLVEFFEDVLTWARNEIEGRLEDARLFSVAESFQAVLSLLSPLVVRKKIKIELNVPPDLELELGVNSFQTILRNLLSNAIKYSKEGGIIAIDVERENQQIQISIRDQGVGMSPEQMQDLFDSDKRKTTLGTSKEKGFGMGLILCYSLVNAMKGSIQVASEKGVGTTFTVELPASG